MLAANFATEPRRSALLDVGDGAHLDAVKSTLQPPRVDLCNRADESFAEFWLDGHRAAMQSVLPELTRAETERDQAQANADLYYRLLYNPRAPITVGPSHEELERRRHDYARNAE